jgi:hypothetical protein
LQWSFLLGQLTVTDQKLLHCGGKLRETHDYPEVQSRLIDHVHRVVYWPVGSSQNAVRHGFVSYYAVERWRNDAVAVLFDGRVSVRKQETFL